MTTREKLKKALEALEYIAEGKCETVGSDEMYAASVHADLTTTRTETVEVKRWAVLDSLNGSILATGTEEEMGNRIVISAENLLKVIELTGTYQRPIPEPETWEGIVLKRVNGFGQTFGALPELPSSWIGHRVVVEVI